MTETPTETKDPVCGMSLDEGMALHAERDGKTYFFCSEHCRQKFLSGEAAPEPKGKAGCCGV